jgi:hypothetical protein
LHILISSHIYAYPLDHMESELEEASEQAQTEEANTDPEQGKPWCI